MFNIKRWKLALASIGGAAAIAIPLALTAGAAQTFTPDDLPLTLLSENNNFITLGWNAYPGYGYLFKTKADANSDWVVVSRTNDPTRTSVRFSKGSYAYGVSALAEGAVGTYSPPVADTQAPSNPTGLASSNVTDTSFNVSWTASTDNVGVTGYEVLLNGSVVQTVNTTSFSFTGKVCNTTYSVGVRAVDAAGNKSNTATLSVKTAACSATVPTPTNLHTTNVTQTSVSLAWDSVTGATNYRIYRNGNLIGQGPGSNGGFSDTWVDMGLTCGSTYTYAVEAQIGTDTSDKATLNVTTTACATADTQAPSNPSGLSTSNVGETSVTLNWAASTDNVGVDHYNMFVNGSQVAQDSASPYTFSGLTCATGYTLGVQAEDAAGNKSSVVTTSVNTSTCSGGGGTMETITPSQFQSRATSGATITNVHVTGSVSINATNVAISNSAFDGEVDFNPSSSGSSLRGSSALAFSIQGADGIVLENNTFDGQKRVANNIIWDNPSGNAPSNWVIRGNTFRNYYVENNTSVHAEAIFVGYSDHGLIENNTFTNNGNTAHIFFSWFGNLASPPASNPHDICVRGNTFNNTWTAYFDINTRDEINPQTVNIKVDPNSNHFTQGVDDSRLLASC